MNIGRLKSGLKSVNKDRLKRSAIPINEFGEDYIRREGKYFAVLKVTDPINRELMSPEDTEKVIDSIQNALNMLQIDDYCQILISSTKVDMENYLKYHDEKLEPLLINEQYGEDRLKPEEKFRIDRIKASKKYMERYRMKARNVPTFFIVLEQDNPVDLDNLVADFIRTLRDGKIGLERMKKKEIQRFIYQKLAPTTSEDQPLEKEDDTSFDITKWTPNAWKRVGFRFMMDDTYFSFFTISYIPEKVSPGWLDSLIHSSLNVDLSLTMRCVDKSALVKSIDRKIRELKARTFSPLPASVKKEIEKKIDGFDQLLEEIEKEDQNIFEATIVICLKEKELDELKKAEKRLKNVMRRLRSRRLHSDGPELLWYTLPIGYGNKKVEDPVSWQMQSDLVASTVPFNSSELNEQKGILIGFNSQNGSPIIYDWWNPRKVKNRSHVILGSGGAGKSFFVKSLLFREAYLGQVDRIFIIDPEREYDIFPSELCSVVRFKPGSHHCTNPFHIRSAVIEAEREGDDIVDIQEYLPQKISQMMTFFDWIFPSLSPVQRSYLRKAIQSCYEAYGLKIHGESHQKLPGTFPTLADLYDRLKNVEMMKEFCIVLEDYVNGIYSSMLNGQTNWELDKKINVFDIKELTKDVQKPMMDLLLRTLWEEVKKDKEEKTLLVCDEAWLLADEKNPMTLEFLGQMAKRSRKYMSGCWTITQNVADFLSVGRYGEAIIGNSYLKTFMYLEQGDLQKLGQVAKLTEREISLLGKMPQGRGIHQVGNTRIEIQVEISEDEQSIIHIKDENNQVGVEEEMEPELV